MNSKEGTTRGRNNTSLVQKAGEAVLNHEYTKEGVIREMAKIKEGLSVEEVALNKEKVEKRQAKIDKAYNEWLAKDHLQDFKDHEIITDNFVIIKVFYYNEMPESNILILDSVADGFHRVYPVAIVLGSSSPKVKPGDVVTIPAVYGKTIQSKEWIQYQKDVREQPTLKKEIPEPQAYVGKLSEWSQYIIQSDPFTDTSLEDQHTFCIPDRYVQTRKK
jgi:hypothetical protein